MVQPTWREGFRGRFRKVLSLMQEGYTHNILITGHTIVSGGLRAMLERELINLVCSEAATAEEALETVGRQHLDLLILDLSKSTRGGIQMLNDVLQLNANLRVLVVSGYPEDQYAKRVLKAGAWGYLNLENAPEEFVAAVRKVLAGRRYVSPALLDKLAQDLGHEGELADHEKLSDRELETLKLLAAGRSVKQIASLLNLAVATISTYRTRILAKTHKTTTAELIRYALDNALDE